MNNNEKYLIEALSQAIFLLELFIKDQSGAAVNTVMEEDLPYLKAVLRKGQEIAKT